MQKVWKIILALSIIANIIFGLTYLKSNRQEYNPKEYIDKIDSLELVLSSMSNKRDSIRGRIDTIFVDLSKTEKDYEEIRDIVINNSTSDDYLFFSEYLKRNRERLDSINNLEAAQGN